jgi:hypothetical protein
VSTAKRFSTREEEHSEGSVAFFVYSWVFDLVSWQFALTHHDHTMLRSLKVHKAVGVLSMNLFPLRQQGNLNQERSKQLACAGGGGRRAAAG